MRISAISADTDWALVHVVILLVHALHLERIAGQATATIRYMGSATSQARNMTTALTT